MPPDILSPETAKWFKESVGEPTAVQLQGWPVIAAGKHALLSAPTGSGKTLAAFLVFIDRLKALAASGSLENKLYLIYISPLKSLGNDIRVNLKRPLLGIPGADISVAVRTGDTTPAERRHINTHPPHILITTPESLYLMLTSASSRNMLMTASAVIIDELHAIMNNKRGAHLMLSLERLDKLCGKTLQRIGLSATVKPLETAAEYLSPAGASIISPPIFKAIDINISTPVFDTEWAPESSFWSNLAQMVYEECRDTRTVIAFVESRAQSERLSYHVNAIGGVDFSRTHHGSISKEHRLEAEQMLKSGRLRLLCATSSMELGIDVGEIDKVLQVGCPRSVSSTMQRLGRAGHNPGRTSAMLMYPHTELESIYCGLTARLALDGGIELSQPPLKCLDVLSQHLVSMAACGPYTVDDVMELLAGTYTYKTVTREEVCSLLRMLAGDFDHRLDHPVRPKVLYDRIHDTVAGDNYSRMLAVSQPGVIPDKGLYPAKLPDGTKLGELEEEFVFEARIGQKFMLGAFAWRITEITRDHVIVVPTSTEGATSPFWKGDGVGRSYQTGLSFGRMLREIGEAHASGSSREALLKLRLDNRAASYAVGMLDKQIQLTGCLPDDKTIIIEHFKDRAGEHQMMVHSVFGSRVNGGLSLIVQEAARRATGMDVSCFDDDDGFMLFPYGADRPLPNGLLYSLDPEKSVRLLHSLLPATPLFAMAFRYNAGRSLMMGMKNGKRQPLWVMRLKSAEVLDNAIIMKDHPLILETRRECLDDYLDISAIQEVIRGINSGAITVREMFSAEPSPMSLPLRHQAEFNFVYDYSPMTTQVRKAVEESLQALEASETISPDAEQLVHATRRARLPQNETELHSLLMAEGDLINGDLNLPEQGEWLESLANKGRALYIEPGLWICAEQSEDYRNAFELNDSDAVSRIVRRLLRCRGAQNAESVSERYFWEIPVCGDILAALAETGEAVLKDGLYYHKDVYGKALKETIYARRSQIKTLPPERYAYLLSRAIKKTMEPEEQLKASLAELSSRPMPPSLWEGALLPARVSGYRPALLDSVLAQGEFFWTIHAEKNQVSFGKYTDIDWEADIPAQNAELSENERIIINALKMRGASFAHGLPPVSGGISATDILMNLSEKGLVHADSFLPVRRWIDKEQIQKAPPKQRARMRAVNSTAGRWELARPIRALTMEEMLNTAFDRYFILCRETASAFGGINWPEALNTLRIWEYTGQVRRGYFIKGLSGAQFIRADDYNIVTLALDEPSSEMIWISAADPACAWGRILPHYKDSSFMLVPGTAVALCAGLPVCIIERHSALKVFNFDKLYNALEAFVSDFGRKRIYPQSDRFVLKSYPAEATLYLSEAGFTRQMQDYVLWRTY